MSPRYAGALCLAIAMALVPTIIHSYAGVRVDDGRTVSAIPVSLAAFTSTPSGRNATWGKRRFDSDDWIERRYISGRDEVLLSVIRSFDLKMLYHHPELAVAYGTSFLRYETTRLGGHASFPVHVLRSATGGGGPVAMYVLHYDGRFVEHPIAFQLRTAGELLVSGRKPMTLFFVQDAAVPDGDDLDDAGLTNVLFAAIDAFVSQRGHPES